MMKRKTNAIDPGRAQELRLMAEVARELAKKFDMTAAGEWPAARLKAFADKALRR